MKNIKRISLIFVLMLSFALLFSVSASAMEKGPYLDNRADTAVSLTEAQETEISAKLQSISESTGLDIVIITKEIPDNRDTAVYARDLYELGGYGQGEEKSGVLLFIYFDSLGGGYEIVTAGEARDIFSENDLDRLEDAIYDYLHDYNFYSAFSAFSDECEYIIENDGKLSPIWILVSLIVGAATAGFAVWYMTSKHKGVKFQRGANSYMLRNTFRLDRSRDVYLYSHVTRVKKPQNNSSGGGRSSSGRSYGGRSGRF